MHPFHTRRRGFHILGGLGALLLVSFLSARDTPAHKAKTIALVGGRILTQTDAGSFEGTVLIRSGVVTAVGPSIAIPADAQQIDVKGFVVTPGLIDGTARSGSRPRRPRKAPAMAA